MAVEDRYPAMKCQAMGMAAAMREAGEIGHRLLKNETGPPARFFKSAAKAYPYVPLQLPWLALAIPACWRVWRLSISVTTAETASVAATTYRPAV